MQAAEIKCAFPQLFDCNLHPDLVSQQGDDKEEFLKRRNKYLFTASDAGHILQGDTYAPSVHQLIKIKRGEMKREPPNDYAMQKFILPGVAMEPVVITHLHNSIPQNAGVLFQTGTYSLTIDDKGTLVGASPDGLLFVNVGGVKRGTELLIPVAVEIKCYASKEEVPTLPLSHFCQMQVQMQAMKVQYALWIGVTLNGDCSMALVRRNDTFWKAYALPRILFFRDCVESGTDYKHPLSHYDATNQLRGWVNQSTAWLREHTTIADSIDDVIFILCSLASA